MGNTIPKSNPVGFLVWYGFAVAKSTIPYLGYDILRCLGLPIYGSVRDGVDPDKWFFTQKFRTEVERLCQELHIPHRRIDGTWSGLKAIINRLLEQRRQEREFRRLQRIVYGRTGLRITNPKTMADFLIFCAKEGAFDAKKS